MTDVLEQTESRPRQLTDAMKKAAARDLAQELAEHGHINANEIEDAARDIAKHAHGPWTDGYTLAKRLDDYAGWDCNFGMAEVLDGWSTFSDDALRKAEKEWASRVNPTPPFANGTRVRVKDEMGTIDGIYDYGPAKYLIKIDCDPRANTSEKSRRIVNFEDVVSIED